MTIAVVKERPFDGRARILPVAEPMTISQIAATINDMPRGWLDECECRVNGDLIPRDYWDSVRPRVIHGRDVVVSFTIPIHGGGGGRSGSKNTVALVATIAVILVAAAITGGALGPQGFALLPGFFAAGSISATVAAAAVTVAGGLAISALTKPPSLEGVGGRKTGIDSKQPASLNGNVLARGSPVPRVLGTHRIFPPLISPPLIEYVGLDQVAEAVFALAGPHAISDMMVGDTSVDLIPEIETEITEGLSSSSSLTLVTRQSYSDTTVAGSLSKHQVNTGDDANGKILLDQTTPANSLPQWRGLRTRMSPDEFWIPLQFPGGIGEVSGTHKCFVPFRVRMRQVGSSTWINLPEFHVMKKQKNAFCVTVKLMWRTALTMVSPPTETGAVRAYILVSAQSNPPGLGGWTADSYFDNGAATSWHMMMASNWNLVPPSATANPVQNINLYEDRIEYYLDPATFPNTGVAYEVQIIRGQVYDNNSFDFPGTYFDSRVKIPDFFGYETSGGTHSVLQDLTSFVDMVQLPHVSTIWNDEPVPDPTTFALIAVKVTNRSIEDFSVLASGYTYDWDGSGWNTFTTTSNPAPHFRDVLGGNLGGDPFPSDLIDDDILVDWRTHCNNQNYTVNAVVEGKTYMEVLNLLASCGYARATHNERWGVFMDKDRSADTPVQIFTPRNMRDFNWSRAFAKLPTGMRVKYNNRDDDYKTAETIVYFDDANQRLDQLEQITYDGLVTEADASTRASFDMMQLQKRMTFYEGTADLEALVCTRGDLVGVQHDILMSQAGFSRIKSVATNAGNITGLTLEGTVPVLTYVGIFSTSHLFTASSIFDLGADTGMAIRYKDGSGSVIKEITAAGDGDYSTITFVTPFADPGTSKIDEGCLVTVGRLGSEYKRLIVFAISPKEDMTASITFVDEAPELWDRATDALINRQLGTNIGNMTSSGGLAAAFNGTTSQSAATSATTSASGTTFFIGKSGDQSRHISKAVVYGSTTGYLPAISATVTLELRAQAGGDAPANVTEAATAGVSLGSISFTDLADESAGRTITSSNTFQKFDHWWIYGSHNGASASQRAVGEVNFYE